MQDFTVSVAEILGHPGEYRDLRIDRPLAGVRTELARLDETEPIQGDLRAESVVEGVLVTGPVTGLARMQCARCLKPFATEVGLEVLELFYGPGHEPLKGEDAYEVSGMEIDLQPMLRDAVVLALPLNPLCREDCKGLCPRCGADWNEGACACAEDESDPRWAALDEVRERLEARQQK